MRTMKQVLAEFQQIQKQLICEGIVEVEVYCGENCWEVSVKRVTFTRNCEIKTRDYVKWEHYCNASEETEQENERRLAEFKEKFNIK